MTSKLELSSEYVRGYGVEELVREYECVNCDRSLVVRFKDGDSHAKVIMCPWCKMWHVAVASVRHHATVIEGVQIGVA